MALHKHLLMPARTTRGCVKVALYRWLCLCRFYRGAPRWQIGHYQRCFNASIFLYSCVLSVLIVKFVTTFGRHGVGQSKSEQLASRDGFEIAGKNRQPRAIYNYNMAAGAYMYSMDIDELDTRRQILKPETAPWLSAPFFPRAVNKTDYDRYIDLLRTLSELFLQANVTFIMCDGTLLGSYLSHGMLPWDDDVDLMVRYSDINKVKAIFTNASVWKNYQIIGYHDDINEYDYSILTDGSFQKDVPTVHQESYPEDTRVAAQGLYDKRSSPGAGGRRIEPFFIDRPYTDYTESFQVHDQKSNATRQRYHKFKFFPRNAPYAGSKMWKWPFIDVKYYMENRTHVWTLDRRTKVVPRDTFYPLHYRPFVSLWLPAPHDTRGFLRNKYGRFRCRSSPWSHREERKYRSKKVRCWRLHSYYPFVWREQSPAGVIETLTVDAHVIHSVVVRETFYPWQRQFELG